MTTKSKNNLISLGLKLGEHLTMLTAVITAFWFLGRPALEDYVDQRISTYHSKKSFSHKLAEEIGVPRDRIHIVFGTMYNDIQKGLEARDTFVNVYMPLLKEEMSRVDIGVYVINGELKYRDADDKMYDVEISGDGVWWYRKNSEWKLVHK